LAVVVVVVIDVHVEWMNWLENKLNPFAKTKIFVNNKKNEWGSTRRNGFSPEDSMTVFERVRTHLNTIKHRMNSAILAFAQCLRAHGVCRDMRSVIVRLAHRAVKEAELEEH
jgi:hypothetical protein